jgi:hypothetical protein
MAELDPTQLCRKDTIGGYRIEAGKGHTLGLPGSQWPARMVQIDRFDAVHHVDHKDPLVDYGFDDVDHGGSDAPGSVHEIVAFTVSHGRPG